MASHNELGKKGELKAVAYLQENGFTILEKNYRYLKAEIDIIVQIGDVVVGVEVKTRSSDYFGNPQDFVNEKKIKLMCTALDFYIVSRDLDVEARFDIIAILVTKDDKFKLEHIEDAFLYF